MTDIKSDIAAQIADQTAVEPTDADIIQEQEDGNRIIRLAASTRRRVLAIISGGD